MRGDAQKPHPKPLSALIICQAVVLLLYKWGRSINGGGGLIWLKHFARLSSFCLSDPSDLRTSFFHITLFVVISPLSCASPLPLVAFALLLSFFLQPHSSLIVPVPYDLPPSLPPDLHYPPPASPLPPLLSSLLSNQICNGAHFSEKKSSHSIATRLLTTAASAATDAGGGAGMWNYIRGDYTLHRLILLLSAVAGKRLSLSLSRCSPHTLCLDSPHLSFIFLFVSCSSVHFSVPLQNYKKNK